MSARSYVYILVVLLGALGVAAIYDWGLLLTMPWRHIGGLLAFVILGIISEALAIDFTIAGRRASSSISFIALLACGLYFPPAATITAAATIQITGDIFVQRRRLWVACFNIAQRVLAICAAVEVYYMASGSRLPASGINTLAFAGMVATLFLVNTIVVSGYYAIQDSKNIVSVLKLIVGSSAANLAYGLLASPAAILTYVVYDRLYIGGLILMLMPMLLIRYSYLSKIQLQQANRDLLKVLVKTIETRDPYTSGHSLRVSHLARMIAEDLGLSRRRVEQVERTGLLHDIGKINSVYTPIIQKPADLTEEEIRVIKTHAVEGAEFLKRLTSLNDAVIEGVRHHHERYDGKGYPDGLRGDSIPLYSRIIMICDAIDAMLSDRPYRSALTIEEVQAELIRCSGTQFDPEITGVIIRSGTLNRARDLALISDPEVEMVASVAFQ